MDEFYSHYVLVSYITICVLTVNIKIYTHSPDQNGRTISCAAYIDDVNKDPIILLDGLTENWRLPG